MEAPQGHTLRLRSDQTAGRFAKLSAKGPQLHGGMVGTDESAYESVPLARVA